MTTCGVQKTLAAIQWDLFIILLIHAVSWPHMNCKKTLAEIQWEPPRTMQMASRAFQSRAATNCNFHCPRMRIAHHGHLNSWKGCFGYQGKIICLNMQEKHWGIKAIGLEWTGEWCPWHCGKSARPNTEEASCGGSSQQPTPGPMQAHPIQCQATCMFMFH